MSDYSNNLNAITSNSVESDYLFPNELDLLEFELNNPNGSASIPDNAAANAAEAAELERSLVELETWVATSDAADEA